jgi:hypothetical protein
MSAFHPRHSDACEDDLDPRIRQDGVEQGGERAVAVPDEEPCPAACVLEVHDEIPRGLRHPGRARVCCGAQDPGATAGVLDDGEHVQSRPGQGDRLEEVAGQQGVGLGAQEVRPGAGAPFGRWADPGLLQDLPYRGGGHLHAQDEQFAVEAAVAPAGILPRQAQDQNADGVHRPRPSRTFGPAGGGVPTRDEVAVPAQYRVRAHQQPHPAQHVQRQPVQ